MRFGDLLSAILIMEFWLGRARRSLARRFVFSFDYQGFQTAREGPMRPTQIGKPAK